MTKAELETKVAKELKEILGEKIYNNESFYLIVEKLIPVLQQLPEEPVNNEYLKSIFTRCNLNPLHKNDRPVNYFKE